MKLHMQTLHGSRMCPMDFGVKRWRWRCKDYWKSFLAHNCSPFTPVLVKLHTQTPHESRMCPVIHGVKRSQCNDYWKWFLAHNCSPFTPILMTLHTQTPWVKDVPYGPWGQKVKVTVQGLLKMVSGAYLLSLYTYPHETSHTDSPRVKDGLWVQKVKGQGHNARITENGFWHINVLPLHLKSPNFTHRFPVSPGY